MVTITYQPGVQTIRGYDSWNNPSISAVDAPAFTNPIVTNGLAQNDLVYSSTQSGVVDSNFKVTAKAGAGGGSPVYSSDTPGVCSVDASGNVSRVADGACTIKAVVGGSTLALTRSIARASSTVLTATGFAAGSLAAHINSNIAAMVNAKTPSDATRNIYSGAARSATAASAGWDLSASSYVAQFPLHLISARHFVCATHVGINSGASITFMRNDNSTQSTVVTGTIDIGNDMRIGLLQDAITGITPYYLLPSTYDTYLPCAGLRNTITQNFKLPVLNIEGNTGIPKFRVLEVYSSDERIQESEYFATWTSNIIGGDSSGPLVLPITSTGNKSVLLGAMYSTSYNFQYHRVLPAIQAAMDALLAGHTLQTINLAGFTAYP